MEKDIYYSNGKLLLTGEYVVLDGALALAIPSKYGQSLEVEAFENHGIHWQSFDSQNQLWFEDTFDSKTLKFHNPQNPISNTLSKILKEAQKLNPQFLTSEIGFRVQTKLDFPKEWGLGTSSTLINNIAQWSKTDAFTLLHNSFGGSGYDIAAAQNDSPILYKRQAGQEITKISLDWNFKHSLFFIYLNQKQDSKKGISLYKEKSINKEVITRISKITLKLLKTTTLEEFNALIEEHEGMISRLIGIPSINESLFIDFAGAVKSLGAWGGDFVMATGTEKEMEYFRNKGYKTIIPFSKMVL